MADPKPPKQPPAFDIASLWSGTDDKKTILQRSRKDVFYRQGDAADALFCVLSGRVMLTATSARDRRAMIGTFVAGDFFGEGCLGGETVRPATATAMEECSVRRLERSRAVDLLHTQQAFAGLLLRYKLRRAVRAEQDLLSHLFLPTGKRLARELLSSAHFGKDGPPEVGIPEISHDMLALTINTSRPRVTAIMNEFREAGLISYNGGLCVHCSALRAFLDS